jgi:hypothetical protein
MKTTLTEKIDDIYIIYLLNDKDIKKTLKFTKISKITVMKYIRIKEELDIELYSLLEGKGKNKLTMGMALYICDNILNPDHRSDLSVELCDINKNLRKEKIIELTTCDICCDINIHFEKLPCCNHYICESCLIQTIESKINDLAFTGIKCPFCNVYFSIHYITYLLKGRFLDKDDKEKWRDTSKYFRNMKYPCKVYPMNMWYKFMGMIGSIEAKQDYIMPDHETDMKPLFGDELYYGPCYICTPAIIKHKDQKRDFRRLRVGSVEQRCVNDENQLVVFQPDMFKCEVCKSFDEDYDNGEFKQCPHCGTKTLKPSGCNYIYCGDHRWCWICNERIENNNNGHNHHYYTGRGSSPYSDRCRESINYDAPRFVIRNKCDCSACAPHGGAPICRSMDCSNRTKVDEFNNFHKDCEDCLNNIV